MLPALVWLSYLKKSKRVAATYRRPDPSSHRAGHGFAYWLVGGLVAVTTVLLASVWLIHSPDAPSRQLMPSLSDSAVEPRIVETTGALQESEFEKLVRLGDEAATRGGYAAAATWYSSAVQLNPSDSNAWAKAGHVYYLNGQAQQALAACDEALKNAPHNTEARLCQGLALAALGRKDLARNAAQVILASEPNHPGAKALLNSTTDASGGTRPEEPSHIEMHLAEQPPRGRGSQKSPEMRSPTRPGAASPPTRSTGLPAVDVVDPDRVYPNVPADVDTVAKKASGASVSYPPNAPRLKSGDSVSVTVSFIVGREGQVSDVTVLESGGKILDDAVVSVIQKWTYSPATNKGIKVKARHTLRQTFRAG